MTRLLILAVIVIGTAGWVSGVVNDYGQVRKITAPPIIEEDFETVGNWTPTTCTVAEDTTYVRNYVTSKKSVQVTPNVGASAWSIQKTFATAQGAASFAGGVMPMVEVTFYSHATTVNDLRYLKVALLDNAGNGNYGTLTDLNYLAQDGYSAGWYTATIAYDTSVDPTVDFTTGIKYIRVGFTPASTKEPVITMDSVKVFAAPSIAHYAYTTDDGVGTEYLVAEYLHSKGLRGTFFIIPGNIGTGASLTLAQLKTMQSWGHLIANHGYAHLTGYNAGTHLTTAAYLADIHNGADWLVDNGFTRGARIWAIAGGDSSVYNWDMKDTGVLRDVADLVRGTFGQRQRDAWTGNPRFSHLVCTESWADLVAEVAAQNARLTDAKLAGHPLVVTGWHGKYSAGVNTAVIDSGGALTAEWMAHIDLVASQKAAGKLMDITLDQLVGDVVDSRVKTGAFGISNTFGNQ